MQEHPNLQCPDLLQYDYNLFIICIVYKTIVADPRGIRSYSMKMMVQIVTICVSNM